MVMGRACARLGVDWDGNGLGCACADYGLGWAGHRLGWVRVVLWRDLDMGCAGHEMGTG
jgi:hypothetical protein